MRARCIMIGLCLSLAAHASPEAELRQFYASVQALQGRFVQRLQDDDGSTLERYEGQFWMQRPGQFRWEYSSPYPLNLGSDGQTLWHHDVDLRQITLRDASATLAGTPAQLLGGDVSQLEAYRLESLPPRDGLQWLGLTPREAESDFAQIRIGLKRGEPREMRLADRLGQITAIEFLALETPSTIDAKRFSWDVPSGTTVVDERPAE